MNIESPLCPPLIRGDARRARGITARRETMKDYSAASGWVIYIPEYDRNREDENPVTVEIKPLKVSEAKKIAGGVTARRAKGGGFQTNQADIQLDTFRKHARNIQNLMYNGKPIVTVEELLDTPLNELASEIEAAISDISILDEGDAKNYERQSDGSYRRVVGTAATAPTNSAAQGTAAEPIEA